MLFFVLRIDSPFRLIRNRIRSWLVCKTREDMVFAERHCPQKNAKTMYDMFQKIPKTWIRKMVEIKV